MKVFEFLPEMYRPIMLDFILINLIVLFCSFLFERSEGKSKRAWPFKTVRLGQLACQIYEGSRQNIRISQGLAPWDSLRSAWDFNHLSRILSHTLRFKFDGLILKFFSEIFFLQADCNMLITFLPWSITWFNLKRQHVWCIKFHFDFNEIE